MSSEQPTAIDTAADDSAYDPGSNYPVEEQQPLDNTEEQQSVQEAAVASQQEVKKDDEEDDEEDEEYDINAGLSEDLTSTSNEVSTSEQQDLSNTETNQVSPIEEEEEEYDPTSEFPELSREDKPVTAENSSPSITQATTSASQVSTTTTNTNTSSTDGIDSSIAQQLSQRLFSDPEFLKLSPAEQQQRVIQEFSKVSNSQLQKHASPELGTHRPNIEIPMSVEERGKYNSFIDNESKYNSRYPFTSNSRLFVGNLPANFSKENVFRIFSVYGNILQISLKNTYAFVQYDASNSVENAIEKEYGVPLYGKDLVLEIAKNSRPETIQQHRNNPSQHANTNEFFESRKRAREEQQYGSRYDVNKRKATTECQIFVKQTADPQYARETARILQNAGIVTEYEFLKPGQFLDKKVKDAAYSGVIGVVLINKNRTVDCSIYQKTPDGGIRYDEYNSINSNDVVKLINLEKEKLGKSSSSYSSSSYNQSNQGYKSYRQPQQSQQPQPQQPQPQQPQQQADLLQTLQNLQPQQLQALLALTGQQQPVVPPPRHYNPPSNNGVDLASLLGKLQPQPQLQQQYGGSSYQPQQPQYGGSSYQPQQPQYGNNNNRYGQPQTSHPPQQQQQPQGNNAGGDIQSLLANLAKFQS